MRLNASALHDRLAESLSDNVAKKVEDTGLLTQGLDFKVKLKNRCQVIRLVSELGDKQSKFIDLCEKLVQDLEIKVAPFYRSKEMQDRGCYDHYANIHETQTSAGEEKWWSEKCQFTVRAQVRIPEAYRDYLEEIQDSLASFRRGLDKAQDIKAALDDLDVTDDLLPLLVEELESRGIHNPTLKDLRAHIDELKAMIDRIKSRV
jgi:hypothetical protein